MRQKFKQICLGIAIGLVIVCITKALHCFYTVLVISVLSLILLLIAKFYIYMEERKNGRN